MARPLKKINGKQVKKLAGFGLTPDEIAVVMNCSRDTLDRRFADVIKQGHERRNSSLRRKQYQVAMTGNVGMLIWLGKQYMGQRDRNELTGQDGQPLQLQAPVFNIQFKLPEGREVKPPEPPQLQAKFLENGDGSDTAVQ
jgi:hypothetical protein